MGRVCMCANISSLMVLSTPCVTDTISLLYIRPEIIPTAYIIAIVITAASRGEKSLLPVESMGVM